MGEARQYKPGMVFDSEAESSDDPETGEGDTQDELIPLPKTEGREALECTSCDLTLETLGEARAQLSSSELLDTEGQETQPGVVLHSRGREGEEVVIHLESTRIHICGTVLERCTATGSTGENYTQAVLGDRRLDARLDARKEG